MISSSLSFAQGVGGLSVFDPSVLSGLLPQDVANALVKTAGLYSVHRPYQGATSTLGTNAIDIYLEATLMKLGDALPKALAANSLSAGVDTITALPTAKLHIRKAFSSALDAGISALSYRSQIIIGGDIKFILLEPEEGPSLAVRIGYTYFYMPIIYSKGRTWNPEVVVSRKLTFAEPYLGVGGRYISGQVDVPYQPPAPLTAFTITKTVSAFDGYLFTGVLFRLLGDEGFRLGIEGSYDLSGFHTIGTTFGIGF